MKIICISGKAQHGKDTTANILKESLESMGKKVILIHFADLLKYLCSAYFGWDGNKDDKGRSLLQYVGTDVVRKQNPNYWVDFVIGFLKMFENEWDYALIPDCRFKNEVENFSGKFLFECWRINRPNFKSPLNEEQQKHPSETDLDEYIFDRIIMNDGTVTDLREKIIAALLADYSIEEI